MADGWTGRDACALQSALRLSNQELAARLGLGYRTVAEWHAKPEMRPRPETQRILDTALEQASPSVRGRFATLTNRTGQQGSADEDQSAGSTQGDGGPHSAMIGANVGVGPGYGFEAPEFGRLLLPTMAVLRDIRDPKSGAVTGMRNDASILYYMIEHFVRVGAMDVAVKEGIYDGAIPTLPRTFRGRLVEINHADSVQSALEICEPIAGELDAEIEADDTGIRTISYHSAMERDDAFRALAALAFNLCDYIRGMRHGLMVTMDLLGMRKAITILLESVSGMDSRANLVTLEQVFSTYQPHEIGAPVIKSTAPARMVEIFDSLVTNPLYRQLSHYAANMGIAAESAESAAAVTRTAKRLTDRDDHLNFGQYNGFIASGRHQTIDSGPSEHFNLKYFPPIVPIGDAYDKATAAWERDAPDFIPVGPHPRAE